MKRITPLSLSLLFVASSLAFAAPERLPVKSDGERSRRVKALTQAKVVDLTLVEDSEVQKALKAVFDALNLKAKN